MSLRVRRLPRVSLQALRANSTVAKRRTAAESPQYIDIPVPVQQDAPSVAVVRGVLPVPRNLFTPQRGGIERASDERISTSTRVSETPLGANREEDVQQNVWRMQMAGHRRANLTQGLQELRDRQAKTSQRRRSLAEARATERRTALLKVDRQDDCLTAVTTAEAFNSPRRGVSLPDPTRKQRIAQMQANVAIKHLQRTSERQLALHSLYVNARDFIVDEKQLDEHIDKVFGTADKPADFSNGPSVWHDRKPETIQDMLDRANHSRSTMDDHDGTANLMKRRLRRVAEELTGGKM